MGDIKPNTNLEYDTLINISALNLDGGYDYKVRIGQELVAASRIKHDMLVMYAPSLPADAVSTQRSIAVSSDGGRTFSTEEKFVWYQKPFTTIMVMPSRSSAFKEVTVVLDQCPFHAGSPAKCMFHKTSVNAKSWKCGDRSAKVVCEVPRRTSLNSTVVVQVSNDGYTFRGQSFFEYLP